MTFCTAHMCGYSPQCEWAYECSDFQLDWITFCILCTCVVSLHYGWACVGLCDWGIVALVAFVGFSPVCVLVWYLMSDCSGGKVALVKLLGHGNWEKHFWVENGLIHWEQQRMSGELFNETDNKFYIFYFGQQGLWAQGFGKMEQKWQFMGKKC